MSCHHSTDKKHAPSPSCHTESTIGISLPLKILLALGSGVMWMISIHFQWLPTLSNKNMQTPWVFAGLCTLAIMIITGNHFYSGAWQSIKRKTATMDTLVALGATSAWIYSMLIVCFPAQFFVLLSHTYFDTPLFVFGFISIGAWIEQRATQSSGDAIEALLHLTPNTVNKVMNGETTSVPLEQIVPGDHLRLLPGEHVPVDGEIIEGNAQIDESSITGEPLWAEKKIGDRVISGTLNTNTSFVMEVHAVGKETVLHQIIDAVRKAQSSKPEVARLVDKISAYFVPSVVLIAITTAGIWSVFGPEPKLVYALLSSLSVLLIACPCALGLATPISIRLGIGLAAKKGILIRNAEALTRISALTAMIFDKTGTLTEGKPSVVHIETYSDLDANSLLQLAASIEQYSEHPIAKAIVAHANEKQLKMLEATQFAATPGGGIEAVVGQKSIKIGNLNYLEETSHATDNLSSIPMGTTVYISINQKLKGSITLSDALRKTSSRTILHLQQLNIPCYLLTGDQESTAQRIATEINIPNRNVRAQATPQDKYDFIEALQETQIVGMVGDGINDAPALAKADVGFAVQSGTDAAIASADVTLMRGGISHVPEAIIISKRTLRNIKQNLFLAFVFNGLGIPIAAGMLYPSFGILLHPIVAAIAMASSSLLVTLNALRVR